MSPKLTKSAMDIDDGNEPKIDKIDDQDQKWQLGQNCQIG
jgi:hypothetical protein